MRSTRQEKTTRPQIGDQSHRNVDGDVLRSLHGTIRDADTKAATLLGGAGGMATALIDLCAGSSTSAVPLGFLLATAAAVVSCLALLLKAGWHLLAAVRPRFGGGFTRPCSGYTEDVRKVAAILRSIAVAKHREIARSIPWLLASGCAAAATIVARLCLWFFQVAM